MKREIALLTGALLFQAACGTDLDAGQEHPGTLEITGIVQILEQGTRSETVILEETLTGDRYSLVGDEARELTRMYGMIVTVTAVPTDEGWTVRPEYPKLLILDWIQQSGDEGRDSRDY
jgi:hypothetical protein